MHCPGGNATDLIRRVLASSQGISYWTPLKPQHSIPCWLSSGNPVHVDHPSAVKKRDHQKFVGGFALSGLLGFGRASMLPLGTLSLGLWVIAVDPAFIAGHQSIKNCRIWIDQLDHLPAVMTTSFFLIFSEHPWDKLRAYLPHLQFLMNNCVYNSHTGIKLCTYYFYRHTTVLIHEILYLAYQLWCSDFLTTPTPLIIPHRLLAFLESLMPLKNLCLIHARCSKSCLKHPIQNSIAYRSSKVSSRPDCIFEINQLWQSGFSRVYSNCCCSCSFEPEILKIGQSSHKMYSNNIVNFQESTTILNAHTKKSVNLLKAPHISQVDCTTSYCLKKLISSKVSWRFISF